MRQSMILDAQQLGVLIVTGQCIRCLRLYSVLSLFKEAAQIMMRAKGDMGSGNINENGANSCTCVRGVKM